MKLIIDTREQDPLPFRSGSNTEIVIKKLDVGDYSIEGFEDKISIERKSLSDLFGTLGSGHKRWKKELERAKDLEYFGLFVEGTYKDILEENYPKVKRTKMRGYVVAKILNMMELKYPNLHIHCCKDRKEMMLKIKGIFEAFERRKLL